MKVSLSWLKELVDCNLTPSELSDKLSLTSIGVKETTPEYIDLDLTYNRGDLLSMRGVAREVGAITDSAITFDQEDSSSFSWVKNFDYEATIGIIKPEDENIKEATINEATTLHEGIKPLTVKVEEPKKCSFYCLAKIEGLKVGPSPKEWVKKLEDCGMRSVNNIADLTNLIMLEFGQPLHAFDGAKVKNETILVRNAKKGEDLTTLDNKKRTLTQDDLVIADEEKALGLAGIMGGKDSEITDSTTTILLEAAIFDPVLIRNSSKKQGMYSEAGKRFIHGLSQIILLEALSGAIKGYEKMGGKLTGLHIQERTEGYGKVVELNMSKLEKLLGITIPEDTVDNLLSKLGFLIAPAGGESDIKRVNAPYYRKDIVIEEDVIEEVARMYGYEKISEKSLPKLDPPKLDQSLYLFIEKLKNTLKEEGLTENYTYPFYSTQVLKNIGWAPNHLDALVKVANPISSETEYMRMILWQNLLEVLTKNAKKGFEDIAFFEIGKIYAPEELGKLPKEEYDLSIALINGSDNPIEELYAIFQKAMKKLGIKVEPKDEKRTPLDDMLFHPTRFTHLKIKGEKAGGIAEVHPRIVNTYGIDKRIAILEISLIKLL